MGQKPYCFCNFETTTGKHFQDTDRQLPSEEGSKAQEIRTRADGWTAIKLHSVCTAREQLPE
jgi:hypothetical protein